MKQRISNIFNIAESEKDINEREQDKKRPPAAGSQSGNGRSKGY